MADDDQVSNDFSDQVDDDVVDLTGIFDSGEKPQAVARYPASPGLPDH